ncbi:MAG: TolC family protein [Bacteroidota bacterium]
MKQIINKLITIILVCLSVKGSAQSLQEFVNAALESNYHIRIMKNEAVIAANKNTAGNAGQLPTIDVNGSFSSSSNSTIQKLADGTIRGGNSANNSSFNLSLLANWTLFDGFGVYAKKDKLGYLEELGQLNSKFYIEQTVADIVMAYYQLVYEHQLMDNYRQSLKISDYRLRLEKKKKELGSGKGEEYGMALVDYQSDSIRLLAQEFTVKSLEIELNRLLNNDLEKEHNIRDTLFTSFPILIKDSLLRSVEHSNNQLEQMRLNELITETELRMARANRYPKIDLFAGYQFSKSFSEVGFINSNRNYGPVVGASISFNLYNGGNTSREIKNSRIYNENALLTKEQMHKNLNADALTLYNEYLSVSKRILLAKSNLDAIHTVHNIAVEQLKNGAINGYDFRQTQLTVLSTELTLSQLQFSLKTIEINLNRLTGKVVATYL